MYPKRHSLFLLFTLAFASSLASDTEEVFRFNKVQHAPHKKTRTRHVYKNFKKTYKKRHFSACDNRISDIQPILQRLKQNMPPDLYLAKINYLRIVFHFMCNQNRWCVCKQFKESIRNDDLPTLKKLIEEFNPNRILCSSTYKESEEEYSLLAYALDWSIFKTITNKSLCDEKCIEYTKILHYLLQCDQVDPNLVMPKSGLTVLGFLIRKYFYNNSVFDNTASKEEVYNKWNRM